MPARVLLLQRPRDWIQKQRNHETQINADIPAIRAELGRNGSNIPSLTHAGHATGAITRDKREHGGDAEGQLGRLVPGDEVVAVAAAEPEVLDHQDEGEADGPVAEHGDEVADDGRQVLAAGDGEHGDDERDQEGPDEARHGVEVVAEQLQAEARGVVDGDVVAADREDGEDEGCLGPAEWVVGGQQEAAEVVVVVGRGVGRVGGGDGGVAEHDAQRAREDGRQGDAAPGEQRDLGLGYRLRVVAVVVGRHGAPAGGVGEGHRHVREPGASAGETAGETGDGRVDVRRGLGEEDDEEDEREDPAVFFKGVDQAESEDGEHVGDDGDDDAADGDGHAVAGDGGQDLSDHDDVDNGETSTDDHVQDGAELGAPETEGVARAGNLAKTELGAEETGVGGEESTDASANDHGRHGLAKGETEFRANDTEGNGANVHCYREPHEEHVPFRRWTFFGFRNAVDALSLDEAVSS